MIFLLVADGNKHYSPAILAGSARQKHSVAEGDEQSVVFVAARLQRADNSGDDLPGDTRRAIISFAFSDKS